MRVGLLLTALTVALMSELSPAEESLRAIIRNLESKIPSWEVAHARDEVAGLLPRSRMVRDRRDYARLEDTYKYGSVASTFREAFRRETGTNPWGTVDWTLPDDDEFGKQKSALVHDPVLADEEPSNLRGRAFSLVASRVLPEEEREAIYAAAASHLGIDREMTSKTVPSVGRMLSGVTNAQGVADALGLVRAPSVVVAGLALVVARAMEVAQSDLEEGRPDFGVTALTSAVEPLLALAKAASLLRRSIADNAALGASEQRELEALLGRLEQYREYIWSSVGSYDLLRGEHIAATKAIELDMEGIRREDQQWGNLVAAAEIIAAVEPPPTYSPEPRKLSIGHSAARNSLEAKHEAGCSCRGCFN